VIYLAEYSSWGVLWEKVYRYKIADVDELKTRLIDKWAQFDQSIVDGDISQWRRRLSAFVCERGAHFEHKFWQFWSKLLYEPIILLNKPFSFYCVLIMSLKSLPQTNDYSDMLQFGTSAFNTVVHWHKLGEVENE